MKNFIDENFDDTISPEDLARLTPGDSRQLARLTAQDSFKNDPFMRNALAYLTANAMCGSPTRTKLKFQLEDGLLDKDI
jgi:hypothetical protein